jgi:hypothetical protein
VSAKTQLLIDERPLQCLPSLACKVGLNEALFLQQLHYWVRSDSGKVVDTERWIFNTYEQWQQQFPFWSVRTIRRIVSSLEADKLIKTRTDLNEMKLDKTTWDTIDYENLQ